MKLLPIYGNFSPTSSHLYSLQVENCDSNSRLVVDEDDNGKLEKVNKTIWMQMFILKIASSKVLSPKTKHFALFISYK